MNQLRAVAVASFFLGIGLAGEPFNPLRALIVGAILALATAIAERKATTLTTFIIAFFGVAFTCYLQHDEIYPGAGVVAFGLAVMATASYGRPNAPAVIAALGALVGTGLFFLL